MPLGGYANRIGHVDLTTGTVTYTPIDEEIALKYIGGRGYGAKLVFDNGPNVEPLSPENILVIMNGPLSGTPINMSGRLAVCTRSPLTGTITDSHMGGWTAARLKWAGFDGIVLRGRAEKPVYLYVENGQISIHDASDTWGKTTHETVAYYREKYGQDVSVMCIGPAGENLVRFASIMNEHDRAAGRGGVGAVMGYKRVKAIVIRGEQKRMYDFVPRGDDRYESARKRGLKAIMESAVTAPNKGGLSLYGTNVLMNATNTIGSLPAKNFQMTQWDQAEKLAGETIRETILVHEPTCHACPVHCKKEVEVKEGKYKVRVESFEYESAWALGTLCLNSDKESVAYLIYLCNIYGMDTIETGVLLAMAMEASERGLLKEQVAWGDADKQIELVERIAYRKDEIANLLAEGPARAAAALGDPQMAMCVKGQAIPAYDPRGQQGMGLSYATSNRGGCHLRGYVTSVELLGIPEKADPLATEGKAKWTKLFQDLHAVSDSLDLCKFSAFAEGIQEYLDQFNAVVGLNWTVEDLLRVGERIYNLERYYNNLCGFTGEHDTLPERLLTQPGSGPASDKVCELEKMLKEYYAERGWENGVVPEAKLKELAII
ncbi:MAG: aldehyde ferredoxin oxidoreductase family protein [Firmicutes bacterium]|nr:aldehyde ferredoxin oxidoreductase family protein [Bacillota bacterium]